MAEITQWFEDLELRARAARSEAVGWSRYGIKPSKRDRIAVVTDSSAAIPEIISNLPMGNELFTVPMPVMIGEQIYADGSPEIQTELPIALASGTAVRTSRPAPGAFTKVFQELSDSGYTKAIVVLISGKLSGTVDAAKMAADEANIAVKVIDSQTAGMTLGNTVLDVLIRSHTGANLNYLANVANRQAQASRAFFTVPNVEQLRRGGRIPAFAGFLGQLLQVRPILTLEKGSISLLERPRSAERATRMLTERVIEAVKGQPSRLVVHCYGNEAQAKEYAESLQKYSTAPIPVCILPAVLAAHLGLGTLAVGVNPDLDYT